MAEHCDREHYIPLRRTDLRELLTEQLPLERRDPFRHFCTRINALVHYELHADLEALKDLYAAFDPDADTRSTRNRTVVALEELFARLVRLMERANFRRLSRAEIERSTQGQSGLFGINMDIDLGVFDRLEIFKRGDDLLRRVRRPWWRLWRSQEFAVPAYQRLVLIFKLRPHPRLDRDIDTEDVFLKVFKDIPKMDLDMLLPGARVRLTRLDRGLIVYPLIAGVGLMIWNIVRDLGANVKEAVISVGAATALLAGITSKIASWTMAFAFGGYGYRSFYSFQVKKQKYSLRLTRSLYYQSLDNNFGVLMRVLDAAEEQECREIYLGYFLLWQQAPAEGWTAAELDDQVEHFLERLAGVRIDFEIGDALGKLERLGLVEAAGARWQAVPIERALERLNQAWDNLLPDHQPGTR